MAHTPRSKGHGKRKSKRTARKPRRTDFSKRKLDMVRSKARGGLDRRRENLPGSASPPGAMAPMSPDDIAAASRDDYVPGYRPWMHRPLATDVDYDLQKRQSAQSNASLPFSNLFSMLQALDRLYRLVRRLTG
jgi:hypothetical protein